MDFIFLLIPVWNTLMARESPNGTHSFQKKLVDVGRPHFFRKVIQDTKCEEEIQTGETGEVISIVSTGIATLTRFNNIQLKEVTSEDLSSFLFQPWKHHLAKTSTVELSCFRFRHVALSCFTFMFCSESTTRLSDWDKKNSRFQQSAPTLICLVLQKDVRMFVEHTI